jgi:hypothetical protein
MSTFQDPIVTVTDAPVAAGTIQWSAVFAGAVAAAAVALVLHGFAAAIGISASSAAPTWRDASFALVLLTGLYLLFAALVSYGFGGYVAARSRTRLATVAGTEIGFSDGMHGLLAWGLATLFAALLALAIAQMTPRLAAPSSGSAGPSASIAGENIIAFDLDRLLRSDKRAEGDINYVRAQAARILLTASSHRGMLPEDRAALVRLVTTTTGVTPPEAEGRINDATAHVKENIARARRSAAILAFMAAAAALLGAAAAWFAAEAGARHREGLEPVPEFWDWNRSYRRRRI